jgi:hypothetical protein
MSDARANILSLWRAVFGGPPAIDADPRLLADLLVRHLPAAPPYGEVERARGEPMTAAEPNLEAA